MPTLWFEMHPLSARTFASKGRPAQCFERTDNYTANRAHRAQCCTRVFLHVYFVMLVSSPAVRVYVDGRVFPPCNARLRPNIMLGAVMSV